MFWIECRHPLGLVGFAFDFRTIVSVRVLKAIYFLFGFEEFVLSVYQAFFTDFCQHQQKDFPDSGIIHLKNLRIFEFPKNWKIACRIFQIFEKPSSNFPISLLKCLKQYLDAWYFRGKCASLFSFGVAYLCLVVY